MPKRIRRTVFEDYASKLIVTAAPDANERCLLLYPLANWSEIEEEVRARPNTDPRTRKFQRLFLGYAEELSADRAGRLLLPSPLREYASLRHTLMMIGQGRKWELWDKQKWSEYRDASISSTRIDESPPFEIAL